MHLTLRGARADGPPGDEIGEILGRDDIEKLAARGHAHVVQIQQQLACMPQALVDIETAVQIGVIDEALPADRGAWLFEVHPHNDDQLLAERAHQAFESGRVLERRLGVVDRARPDDGQQPVVLAVQQMVNRAARLEGELRRRLADRKLLVQLGRRDDVVDGLDSQIFGFEIHGIVAGSGSALGPYGPVVYRLVVYRIARPGVNPGVNPSVGRVV